MRQFNQYLDIWREPDPNTTTSHPPAFSTNYPTFYPSRCIPTMETKQKKSNKTNNNKTVFQSNPQTSTHLESFLGGITVSSFIVIWLASASSPLIFALSLLRGYYHVASFVIIVTIISYLPWKRGRISNYVQRFVDTYHPSYYNGVSICFEGGEVPSSQHRQTFFAVHPHGAFCIGWALLFTSSIMHGVRFCFAPSLFASPFFRLFSRSVGRPGSAARSAMEDYLKNGEDVALPPGGFEEATLTCTTQDRVFIKKRYGFVRLCLKYGVAIRPVYVFGEGRLFGNVQGMWKTRLALNRWGIPTILVWGSWFFPLLPKKGVNLHIVVGKPLIVPKVDNPTKEEVIAWHEKYITELKRIYEEYKEVAYEDGKVAKLEVW